MPAWDSHWFGGMLMFVFWILLAVGLFLLVRELTSRSGAGGQVDHPENALGLIAAQASGRLRRWWLLCDDAL